MKLPPYTTISLLCLLLMLHVNHCEHIRVHISWSSRPSHCFSSVFSAHVCTCGVLSLLRPKHASHTISKKHTRDKKRKKKKTRVRAFAIEDTVCSRLLLAYTRARLAKRKMAVLERAEIDGPRGWIFNPQR